MQFWKKKEDFVCEKITVKQLERLIFARRHKHKLWKSQESSPRNLETFNLTQSKRTTKNVQDYFSATKYNYKEQNKIIGKYIRDRLQIQNQQCRNKKQNQFNQLKNSIDLMRQESRRKMHGRVLSMDIVSYNCLNKNQNNVVPASEKQTLNVATETQNEYSKPVKKNIQTNYSQKYKINYPKLINSSKKNKSIYNKDKDQLIHHKHKPQPKLIAKNKKNLTKKIMSSRVSLLGQNYNDLSIQPTHEIKNVEPITKRRFAEIIKSNHLQKFFLEDIYDISVEDYLSSMEQLYEGVQLIQQGLKAQYEDCKKFGILKQYVSENKASKFIETIIQKIETRQNNDITNKFNQKRDMIKFYEEEMARRQGEIKKKYNQKQNMRRNGKNIKFKQVESILTIQNTLQNNKKSELRIPMIQQQFQQSYQTQKSNHNNENKIDQNKQNQQQTANQFINKISRIKSRKKTTDPNSYVRTEMRQLSYTPGIKLSNKYKQRQTESKLLKYLLKSTDSCVMKEKKLMQLEEYLTEHPQYRTKRLQQQINRQKQLYQDISRIKYKYSQIDAYIPDNPDVQKDRQIISDILNLINQNPKTEIQDLDEQDQTDDLSFERQQKQPARHIYQKVSIQQIERISADKMNQKYTNSAKEQYELIQKSLINSGSGCIVHKPLQLTQQQEIKKQSKELKKINICQKYKFLQTFHKKPVLLSN